MKDKLIDQIIQIIEDMISKGEEIPDELAQEVTTILQEATQGVPEQPREPLPPGADLLWILSGSDPKAFAEYLKTIPDPALNALASNPSALQSAIQRLGSQITLPAGESEGGVPKAPLNSSNIYGFQYNPRDGRLKVRFQSGSVYSYDAVPPQIFKIFQSGAIPAKTDGHNKFGMWWKGKNPSLGAAFHELIKLGGYPYKRLK